jgi:hypothetical protein
MEKAKFINKYYGTGYQRDFVFLEYEYKGKKYEVYENRAKGNIPLSWQHKNAQIEIDVQIEREEKQNKEPNKEPKTIDYFFDAIDLLEKED